MLELPGIGPFGYFDPLRLSEVCNGRLDNGRLAMIAVTAFAAQEEINSAWGPGSLRCCSVWATNHVSSRYRE
jgi:hypothetical protein